MDFTVPEYNTRSQVNKSVVTVITITCCAHTRNLTLAAGSGSGGSFGSFIILPPWRLSLGRGGSNSSSGRKDDGLPLPALHTLLLLLRPLRPLLGDGVLTRTMYSDVLAPEVGLGGLALDALGTVQPAAVAITFRGLGSGDLLCSFAGVILIFDADLLCERGRSAMRAQEDRTMNEEMGRERGNR